MDTQPPEDPSVHLREQIADLKADIAEVKQLLRQLAGHVGDRSSLTYQANIGYYSEATLDNQEKNLKEASTIYTSHPNPVRRPNEIPCVSEGKSATCIRCGHTWVPFVRRPKKCPSCRQAWYKPKAWTRTKSLIP